MTETELDLARRLVAHPNFKWALRMRCIGPMGPGTFVGVRSPKWFEFVEEGKGYITVRDSADYVPDLADPATQGCLIAMLDECVSYIAHRHVDADGDGIGKWTVTVYVGDRRIAIPRMSKGEAYATALLRAWGEA
jgi:hypothetical protein